VFFRVGLLACLLVCLTNCTRPNGLSPRVAVLRFENLSGDPALDWMGRGFSEIISGELAGSPQRYVVQWRALHSLDAALGKRPPTAPGISAERTLAMAAGADEILYGGFSVLRGMLRATVVDDGRGGADASAGTGLSGVERRLATFDGILAVSSPPGGPTIVVMEVPCALSSAKISSY